MTAIATPRHRVSAAVAHVHDELDAVVGASVWSMDPAETGQTLIDLVRAEARIAELKARVAAHADDLHVGQDVGASSAANWLAHQTRSTRPTAHGTVRLGRSLEQHPLTRDALAAGDVLEEQARVILRWVDRLPDTLDPDTRIKAEAHLLEQAKDHDARDLNHLGRHLYEVVAPDQADADEAKKLAAEEAAAEKNTYLRTWDDGQGTTHGEFEIPTLHGAALKKALMAIMAPRHQAATHGPGVEKKPTPQALGQAFCELLARYPEDRLPNTGGLNATVLVLIDEDSLLGRVEKAGLLETGDKISPGLARRLACEAGIIPVVLGGDSVPLDVGRKRRCYTEHQRLALFVQYRGCAEELCDRTTGLHAHHATLPWAQGGNTDLKDAKPTAATTTASPTTPTTTPPTSPTARSGSTDERDSDPASRVTGCSLTTELLRAPHPDDLVALASVGPGDADEADLDAHLFMRPGQAGRIAVTSAALGLPPDVVGTEHDLSAIIGVEHDKVTFVVRPNGDAVCDLGMSGAPR